MSAIRPVSDFLCGFCSARAGSSCTTAGGVERSPHVARYDSARSFALSSTWVVRLLEDDPQFDLAAGDELLVMSYPYDAKVTVIRRISDGFDPQCNQYLRSVEYVRVAEHEQVGP